MTMKKLDRNDERIVRAMYAKDSKLDAAYNKNEEKIANIEEEFRRKLEEKKKELVEESARLQQERNKLNESVYNMYEATLPELMNSICSDAPDDDEEAPEVNDGCIVVDEDEAEVEEEVKEETKEPAADDESLANIVESQDDVDADDIFPEEGENIVEDEGKIVDDETADFEASVNTTLIENKSVLDKNALWNDTLFNEL